MSEASGPAVDVDLQLAIASRGVPPSDFIEAVLAAALVGLRARAALTVRVVGKRESRALNRRFRGQDRATNVLAFAAEGLSGVLPDFLGDIVICAPVVVAEARAQGKSARAHFAHMVTHGALHLLGFDHISAADAKTMERRERAILSSLGFPDPYTNQNQRERDYS